MPVAIPSFRRVVLTDVHPGSGETRFHCRHRLRELGVQCVCKPVDLLDFDHCLRKADDECDIPSPCRFDLVIVYGVSYGAHGTCGLVQQDRSKWSRLARQYEFLGAKAPHVPFVEAVLGQNPCTTVIAIQPWSQFRDTLPSPNLNSGQMLVRILNRGHFRARMGYHLETSTSPLMALVAGANLPSVAQHVIPNSSGELQLDLTSCIRAALHSNHGNGWVLGGAAGRLDFYQSILDPQIAGDAVHGGALRHSDLCAGWEHTKEVWMNPAPYLRPIRMYRSYFEHCLHNDGAGVKDDGADAVVGRVNLKRIAEWTNSRNVRWRQS